MKIVFFTYNYPCKHNTSDFAFVKHLVDAIAKFGNDCHVVVPYNIFHYRKSINNLEKYEVGTGHVIVYRPYFFSFSKIKVLQKFVGISRNHALKKACAKLPHDIDVVYCHFWSSGYEGFQYAKKKNLPLFVATGESNISKMFSYKADVADFCNYVKGVICVSSKNMNESILLGLTIEEKCSVFPNSVNNELFHKLDRSECRMMLNIPQDVFVIVFVGWFNDRKGILRVSDAISKIEGEQIYSIFIGKGDLDPTCNGILFKGELPHNEVPKYLNAADVFVLPTLHEGCCNAVVEAMACGIPIVSSNLPFNWDVLDDTNSIMINPNDIEEIKNAITRLRDDKDLREKLSKGAIQKASGLTIEKRALAVVDFIKSKM